MGPSRSCWNGTTNTLQPKETTSKGTRVSCVYYQQKCPYEKSPETYLMILEYIYIYIYIYIYVCKFIESDRHFLPTYFLLILSNCSIDLMIFGGNWLINIL